MRIVPGDPQAARAWAVTAGVHPLKVKLSTTTRRVRAGTPLWPTPAGWEVCPPDQTPWAFSADYRMPGDECMAWREVTIDMGQILGTPGTRFRIADVDDTGGITFELDEDGPHAVLWDTYALLTCRGSVQTLKALVDRLLAPQVDAAPAPEPEPDYRNHVDLEPPLSDLPPPQRSRKPRS